MLSTVFFATVRNNRCTLWSTLFRKVTGKSATRSCGRHRTPLWNGLKGSRVSSEGRMPTRSFGLSR